MISEVHQLISLVIPLDFWSHRRNSELWQREPALNVLLKHLLI